MPRAVEYLNGVLPSVLSRAAGARAVRDNFVYPELNHDRTQTASHTTTPTLCRLPSSSPKKRPMVPQSQRQTPLFRPVERLARCIPMLPC